MTLPSSSSSDSSSSPRPRPQTVSEVLCREVGAAHPDGALKQIRTMKRLLRSHYVAQKRLERHGVSSVAEAVETIEALRMEVRALKTKRRETALANASTLDDALGDLERLRSSLYVLASRSNADASDADASDADASDAPRLDASGGNGPNENGQSRNRPGDDTSSVDTSASHSDVATTPSNARHDALERRLHAHRQRIAELEAQLDAARTSNVES